MVVSFKQNLPVDIVPDNQVAVRQGQEQKILCKLPVPLQVCRFTIPGETSSLVLRDGQSAEDGIAYYGEGLKKGHCGVAISTIREKHDGNVTCFLTPDNGRSETSATVRMIVAKAPLQPQLTLNSNYPYKTGEKMVVSCVAMEGRPPANVSLYLDNEPIGVDDRPMLFGRRLDDNDYAELNTSRSVTPSDNGKTLRCRASHIALQKPLESSRQIEVYFPPQEQDTIHRFGYDIGRPGKVNVTVHANPKPTFTWNVDNVKITAGQPDITGRLQTSTAVDLGHGYWSVELNIDSVQKSDTEKEYSLEAHNSEGYATYKITLSSASEPAGVDLDAGSIIGIVVGVLILILAVFLVVFARATGRWCFAGGSAKRNIGESSDTESTGRYSRTEVDAGKNSGRPRISLSQLFKRNKDKVSGADTDTVRTVVTMDDEKIPVSELTTARETPTSGHEGGIVYAELDLAHQQQQTGPRRVTDDKTEYAEILYTKPEGQPQDLPSPDK
ncbi:hypothetical protein TSAR_004479 [Trichomalopsis sarcophagae]|uniref:Ig-like domain-containing protein n=1 Tax=Trichomalopsis sarcophagae TaxID=543379 RepID=A0A232FJE2_9HYME|nr:hypothetical protein TSAR_004479 [Trichomalopsis sarcophagae]